MRTQGFTLIELLIVIAIAAIIAGAMVPMFNVTREEAKRARADSEMDTIKTAAIMMHHDTGKWPVTGDTGEDIYADAVSPFAAGVWRGPYIDQWIPDQWTRNYVITNCGDTSTPIALYIATGGRDGAVSADCTTPAATVKRILMAPDQTK